MSSPIVQAIGDTLTIMVGVMISPVPLAGLIVVLSSKGGRSNAIVFSAGVFLAFWLGTFLVAWVGDNPVAVSGGDDGASMWPVIVHGSLGAFLLVVGILTIVKSLKKHSPTNEPRWMQTIDVASKMRIFGVAMATALANLKNLPLVISAGVHYAQADLGTAQLAVVVTVFAIMGSLLMFLPIAFVLVAPKTSTKVLDQLRSWLIAHGSVVLAVVFIVIGFNILGKAISGLD